MTHRARIENPVVAQYQRDRRIELPESPQHPVLPHRLVVSRDSHGAEQLLGDIDLSATMHALIFAVADNVAFRLGAGDHLFHVALAHALQRFAGQDVHVPGLRIHRRRRPLGDLDDLFDNRARHRLGLETAYTSASVYEFFEIHGILKNRVAGKGASWRRAHHLWTYVGLVGTLPPSLFELRRTSRFAHPTIFHTTERCRSMQVCKTSSIGLSHQSLEKISISE